MNEFEEQICLQYQNCETCPLSIHKELLTTIKHKCTAGMSAEEKNRLLDEEDYYI